MRIDMKMEKMSQKALERKSNKPIMEKKRRARINHCLNQLKALILETDNERSRHSKLEKADILEMTVRYLQTLRTYHLHLTQLNNVNQVQTQSPPCAPQRLSQQQQQLIQFQQQHHSHNSTPSPILNLSASSFHQQQLAAQLQLHLQPLHLQQSPQQSPLMQHGLPQAQVSPTWRPW